MIKRLIVNADDYGLSEGVCLGILKAHRDGILTSTTCMMNMENIEKYLEMTKDYPNLGLGVHLNITVGKPLTNVSFVDEKEILNQEILIQIERLSYLKKSFIKNGKLKLKNLLKSWAINQPI